MAGDFNQRIPRKRPPVDVYRALERSLGPGLRVFTAGRVPGAGGELIDHVAVPQGSAPPTWGLGPGSARMGGR